MAEIYYAPEAQPLGKYEPDQAELETLERSYCYHAPKADQLPRYSALRLLLRGVELFILCNCPKSRERSIAITSLQDAGMWANASIARNE